MRRRLALQGVWLQGEGGKYYEQKIRGKTDCVSTGMGIVQGLGPGLGRTSTLIGHPEREKITQGSSGSGIIETFLLKEQKQTMGLFYFMRLKSLERRPSGQRQ